MTYLLGTDYSHWNGDVNIKTAEAANVKFWFFKATQGYALKDDRYDEYSAQAIADELIWGPYHFFQADLDPIRQAKFFFDTVGKYKGLPPVIDFELTYGMSKAVVNDRLWRFVVEVERLFGVKPIIYTRGYFWNYWIERSSKWAAYPLWIANYEVAYPYLPADWNIWTFWQYTAEIPGATYGVSSRFADGNYTLLTYEELQELAGVEMSPGPDPEPNPDCAGFNAFVFASKGLRVHIAPKYASTAIGTLPFESPVVIYGTEYEASSKISWGKISKTKEEWVALSWITMSL